MCELMFSVLSMANLSLLLSKFQNVRLRVVDLSLLSGIHLMFEAERYQDTSTKRLPKRIELFLQEN